MADNIFITNDLYLALALTVIGFSIRSAENVVNPNGKKGYCFELDATHNGINAEDMRSVFYDKGGTQLASRVDEILVSRGITSEEYALMAFDAARAALQNRKPIVFALQNNKPLIAKKLKDGRHVIYREGTPPEKIKILIENA